MTGRRFDGEVCDGRLAQFAVPIVDEPISYAGAKTRLLAQGLCASIGVPDRQDA
jgi:hypothetical protein